MAKKKRGNPNIHKEARGHNFAANPQNINRNGRPRRILVSDILERMNKEGIKQVTTYEVKDLYLALLNCNESDLEEIANSSEQPMLNKVVASAILSKKGFEVIAEMLDRAIGKAEQKIQMETSPLRVKLDLSELPLDDLSDEELKVFWKVAGKIKENNEEDKEEEK